MRNHLTVSSALCLGLCVAACDKPDTHAEASVFEDRIVLSTRPTSQVPTTVTVAGHTQTFTPPENGIFTFHPAAFGVGDHELEVTMRAAGQTHREVVRFEIDALTASPPRLNACAPSVGTNERGLLRLQQREHEKLRCRVGDDLRMTLILSAPPSSSFDVAGQSVEADSYGVATVEIPLAPLLSRVALPSFQVGWEDSVVTLPVTAESGSSSSAPIAITMSPRVLANWVINRAVEDGKPLSAERSPGPPMALLHLADDDLRVAGSPGDLSLVQVVAVARKHEPRSNGSCRFAGAALPRVDVDLTLRAHDVATGRKLGERRFEGAKASCPSVASRADQRVTVLPHMKKINAWLLGLAQSGS